MIFIVKLLRHEFASVFLSIDLDDTAVCLIVEKHLSQPRHDERIDDSAEDGKDHEEHGCFRQNRF